MKSRTNSGNQDQFAGDLIRMQEQLFFYALQLTEDRDDALDLVQETSYKALKNRTRLHNEDHIRAWLYTILKNTYINYLRSSQYRQLVYDSDEISQYPSQGRYQTDTLPDEELMNKELHDIIKLLPREYGRPIHLFITGYSYKEISQQMKIPIGTVKSRIHLGKKQIKKVYLA